MLAMEGQITLRGRELLSAILADGEWMSRAKVAKATNKNGLSPHDAALLARMVGMGLIEVREVNTTAPSGIRYEYRAAPKTE